MIGWLWTRVRKQPIIALHFKSETVLKFYKQSQSLADANVSPPKARVRSIVLQQSSKKWASFRDGGPHRVTSSNIHQIKAKSLPNSKVHGATSVCRGLKFYEWLKKGTDTNK